MGHQVQIYLSSNRSIRSRRPRVQARKPHESRCGIMSAITETQLIPTIRPMGILRAETHMRTSFFPAYQA